MVKDRWETGINRVKDIIKLRKSLSAKGVENPNLNWVDQGDMPPNYTRARTDSSLLEEANAPADMDVIHHALEDDGLSKLVSSTDGEQEDDATSAMSPVHLRIVTPGASNLDR